MGTSVYCPHPMNDSGRSNHRRHVAFLALGSIGDVVPLLTLAGRSGAASLITHETHCPLLQGTRNIPVGRLNFIDTVAYLRDTYPQLPTGAQGFTLVSATASLEQQLCLLSQIESLPRALV